MGIHSRLNTAGKYAFFSSLPNIGYTYQDCPTSVNRPARDVKLIALCPQIGGGILLGTSKVITPLVAAYTRLKINSMFTAAGEQLDALEL